MGSVSIPVDVVGGTNFGRYPKISSEKTLNMIVSDGFLVPYAGYKKVVNISDTQNGRGIYASTPINKMIAVVGNSVYIIGDSLFASFVGAMQTYSGDVYIEENNVGQIAICDREEIYIYDHSKSTFTKLSLDFKPGYITFQNGRFLAASLDTNEWRLSEVGNGLSWPSGPQYVGKLTTKPDNVTAVERFPGRGNLLYVFGNIVTESWQDVGSNLFPYQRSSSINMDYGCISASTISSNQNMIVWLSANERSGAAIMVSTGGDPVRISTDGLDFQFSNLKNPKNSYGFLFRQDGHLLYQFTFPDDNISYVYDFNEKMFFSLTDHKMGAHIAKQVTYFNGSYYFVSFNDGNIYELSTKYTNNDGKEIPRVRVCKTFRLADTSRFVVNDLTFLLEQGVHDDFSTKPIFKSLGGQIFKTLGGKTLMEKGRKTITSAVDLSISKNGTESFGNFKRHEVNPIGKYKNSINYRRLGAANEITIQLRFYGLGRFVAGNGIMVVTK